MTWDERLLSWFLYGGLAAFFLGGLSATAVLIWYMLSYDLLAGLGTIAVAGAVWSALSAKLLNNLYGFDNEDDYDDDGYDPREPSESAD